MAEHKESLEQIRAFDYYFALGESRSLPQVAAHMGRSRVTIKKWSSKFNWADRVRDRDREVGQELIERTNERILDLEELNRQTIGQLTEKFAEDVRSGKIRASSIQDYERIFKMAQSLGPGDGSSSDGNLGSLAEIIKQSAEILAGIPLAPQADTDET